MRAMYCKCTCWKCTRRDSSLLGSHDYPNNISTRFAKEMNGVVKRCRKKGVRSGDRRGINCWPVNEHVRNFLLSFAAIAWSKGHRKVLNEGDIEDIFVLFHTLRTGLSAVEQELWMRKRSNLNVDCKFNTLGVENPFMLKEPAWNPFTVL